LARRKGESQRLTKLQIIANLYNDKLISERVLWNLLGARFRKHEIELIDEGFERENSNTRMT
jgi:hypothetical protein